MENKIEAQSISLPKGGGAITGIGESFSPSEFSGTASMSIPIATSSCRDAEPSLALQYSSGAGNGPFGLGFSLSTPAISRATNKGTPNYNETDHFVIDGGNYLVPLKNKPRLETLDGQEYRVQLYAPRQLNDFSLIEYWQLESEPESPASFWKVTSKDHVISIFGRTDYAQIVNPDNNSQVFSWLLEEVYDTKGNHQLYHYKKENSLNVPEEIYEKNRSIGAQRYLSCVCYGNDEPIADSILLDENLESSSIEWHFEVVFNYGEYELPTENHSNPYEAIQEWDCRPDPFSSYLPGFEVRTFRRCKGVMLFHRCDILPTLRYATDGASSPHREAFLRSTWRLTEVPR